MDATIHLTAQLVAKGDLPMSCDKCDDLKRRLVTLRDEIDVAIRVGISDSTYDRLERMLSETDARLCEWYEDLDHGCVGW